MTKRLPIDYPRDRAAPTRKAGGNIDWTPALDARLTALWHERWATAEIGRRMGITKSAVVGRAHRLHLPARASPITNRHQGGSAPMTHPAPRPLVPTLAELTAPRHEPGRYPRRVWTAEQDARLVRLRADGTPFWNCGEALGVSRQACQERWKVIGPAHTPAAAPADAPQAAVALAPAAAPPAPAEPLAASTGRAGCQYPLWDQGRPTHRYCGEPVGRRVDGTPLPYCRAHHLVCHTAYAPRVA